MYRHKLVPELKSLKRCVNNVLFRIQDPNWLHSQQSQWKFDWIDFFTFPIYFQYSYLEYKYSYFPHLVGLTSVDPVRGRYRINRFSQHEIVADLIYQRHKFCIFNFTSQQTPASESWWEEKKAAQRRESLWSEDDQIPGERLRDDINI